MLFLLERKYNEQQRQRYEREQQRVDCMVEFFKNMLEQAAEERRQAAAERVAYLDALNRLAEAINRNGLNRE